MSVIAIIVAAGSGVRFGAKKQFIEVAGRPLYYYSIEAFRPYADRIILVVPKEDVDTVEPYGAIVAAGGNNRYDSVYNAVKKISEIQEIQISEDMIVMIHDAARPMITSEVIERVLADTKQCGAAAATTAVVDTIRTIDGVLVDRTGLRAMQTPQSFRYSLLRVAFDRFMSLSEENRNRLNITDDVEVVALMEGVNAKMSEGDPGNIKVTTPYDLKKLILS